jgi:hypothetical protein
MSIKPELSSFLEETGWGSVVETLSDFCVISASPLSIPGLCFPICGEDSIMFSLSRDTMLIPVNICAILF